MDRIKQTEENNRAWFGGQCFAGHAYDPEFDEIAQRFLCGDVLSHGTLTDKLAHADLIDGAGPRRKAGEPCFYGIIKNILLKDNQRQ